MTIFSLASYKELLFKCECEIQILSNCKKHPDYDFTLFNIVIGLNHVFEWFLKDDNIDRDKKVLCISKFNPYASCQEVSGDFNDLYRSLNVFPDPDPYQEVIRKLCNKAKHFKKRTSIEQQDKHYTSIWGAQHMQFNGERADYGGFNHYLYFVSIDGVDINLADIVNTQFKKWIEFSECA